MTQPVFDMKVRDLAEKIYVDLVTNAVSLAEGGVKMSADPTNIAALSFKLAAAFHVEQDKLNSANLPKNQDFKVGVDDIAKWMK